MRSMDHLCAKSNFRIIDFDKTNIKSRYLIRHTPKKDLIDPSTNKLDSELVVIQSGHLKDYSTNLLGQFQVDDVQLVCTKESYDALWTSDDGEVFLKETDFETANPPRGHFFLPIGKFHNISFSTESEQEGEDTVTSKVKHTPILANFWHCSIRWYCNGDESTTWGKGRLNRMKALIRSMIVEAAEFKEPIYQSVDPQAYSQLE